MESNLSAPLSVFLLPSSSSPLPSLSSSAFSFSRSPLVPARLQSFVGPSLSPASPMLPLRAFARQLSLASTPSVEHIVTSQPAPSVSLIQLNRPKALNALSADLFKELNLTLKSINDDHLNRVPNSSKCIILTGSSKTFAAGADIIEMKDQSLSNAYASDFLINWSETIRSIKIPIIAAVSGFALGGGCELAMMCDIILASSDAKFGQPEVNLGVIPGAGGTQRLIRSVGKSKAMELILTGQHFSAQEAYDWGLISRVIEGGYEQLLKEAIQLAENISSKPKLAVQAAKESINSAYEMELNQGLIFEKRLFHMLFGTNDQKEGMKAFSERRKPEFTDS